MHDRLSEQVNDIVARNRHLILKSEEDDKTINLMRTQYDTLAGQVEDIRANAAADVEEARRWADQQVTAMMIERDLAARSSQEIEGLLAQAADLIMQAMRARIGNATPERMPDRNIPHIEDDRLPLVRLS